MLHNIKFVNLYVKIFNVVIKDFLSSGKIAETLLQREHLSCSITQTSV